MVEKFDDLRYFSKSPSTAQSVYSESAFLSQKCSFKKVFAKFTGEDLWWSLFFIKILKRDWNKDVFRGFCDIFINSCCYRTPPVTGSVYFLLDGLYFSLKPITHDVIWICYSVSPCSIAFIANRDNKGLDSELTMIFESKHILWLDTSWNYREENNQNLGKDILTEHTDKTFECASHIAIYYLY